MNCLRLKPEVAACDARLKPKIQKKEIPIRFSPKEFRLKPFCLNRNLRPKAEAIH